MPEVVVITGASAGVGRAVVRRFARRRCKLGLIARGRERLDATAAEVEEAGGEALVLPLDVADAEAVEEAAGRVEEELGPIDIWVNDAMATIFAPVLDIEPAEYRRATEVTYLGTVWGTMAALRRMKPRDRGTIVQVGSALAYRAIPLQAPYCGAKAAVKSFTEAVRTELLHDHSNVRITMVQLPAHNTPQFSWGRTRMPAHPQPVPPIFQPEVAAQAVEHAAYRPRRELYVSWPVVKVVLGEKFAPRFVDRYLARNGYRAQQADDKPMPRNRPDNLFDPAPDDYAARGAFDDRAKPRSLFLWADLHRGALAAGGLALALAARRRMRTEPNDEVQAGLFGRFAAAAVVGLRFLIVPAWLAAAIAATIYLPALTQSQSGGLTQLVSTSSPSYRAELRSLRLFRFPIVADTESVQRDPNGLSHRTQVAVVRRAVRTTRAHAHAISFALPVVNTLGVFPGSQERSTTAITYLFFRHTSSLEHEHVLGHAYARGSRSFVGLTGPGPARLEQYNAITGALPWVALATVAAIGLLVGLNFRAPGPPLLVLAAGGIAYLVDIRALGWVSAHVGVSIPSEIEPLLVVLLLGITTDYSIFYLSRQRRELADGRSPVEAARRSAAQVTPIVFTAGLIVAGGTAALLVGRIDFLRAFGPGLALTALVCSAVSMTFVPAALALGGRRIYWPSAERIARSDEGLEPPERSLRRRVSYWATTRPLALLIVVVCVAGLGAAASGLARTQLGFGLLSGLPDSEAKQAGDAATKGFAPGIVAPAQLVVERRGIAARRPALVRLEHLLEKEPGVAGIIGPREQPFRRRVGAAFSSTGNAARFALVFSTDPFGAAAIHNLRSIQDQLPTLLRRSGLAGARAEFSGGTATAADTIAQVLDDLTRIALVTLAVDFLVLAFFLRALVAPLYLLGASVLALTATLGLTTYVFQDVLGYGDLTYYVPFGVAVLLVSLGSDYNLFVTGRIWEEAGRRPLREAVSVAAPNAARTITLAGVVLAVSFALLAIVPLRAFAELAFAMCAGIVIDAFIVRSFLVPALISLFGETGAWPGGRLRRAEPALEG